ncbi:cysteine desulfurase sulfur acceptor subunit CsdE [Zophobihabitans entericus]|uniref:Cysteine desulfurase sulfur acceptor subunit CsdE n=1 Tax=Zophobihabitans entericus TaxID=1635327 RepID=A0A6G9I7T7_9GAMM|nr:cysteine desulfurase sulfur acceptor subunit CsdE [Zophobihabitans entericus]QIQ20273.1 cysteine desulfurase sulfur acceptor subunit CsdE [Zophobihabitans entericus]
MLTESELIALFVTQTNWQDRYRLIIQQAKQLPDLAPEQKTDELLVSGCENKVWIGANKHNDNTLTFFGDSDGRIVKGLLAILITLVNGKTTEQIQNLDIEHYFEQLHIKKELSQSKQIGLQSLIKRIKELSIN